MTQYHDRASGPPRPFLPPPPGQPESELQATARKVLTELGYVWLGDLSGWEVVPVIPATPAGAPLQLELRHRCGWTQPQPFEGITGDGAAYVGNLALRTVEAMQGHVCQQHEPSPEHQERVARWMEAARDQGLTEGRRLFRAGHLAEAEEPLARDILGDDAVDQLRIVQAVSRRRPSCPTCHTPADDDGTQREHHLQCPGFRLVDGPGCTPAVVADDRGEVVPAGSLYADKCAECTTGASCEDARTCLFEG